MQCKVCDAIFLKVYGFRSISGLEKGKQEGDGLFKGLDKNVSKGILGLHDYRINTDDC